MNVVRDFYQGRGRTAAGNTIQTAMKAADKKRKDRIQARKRANKAAMVSGGLCKSVKT